MRSAFLVIGGAAAGAGLALLFGPGGARTRSLIRDKAVKYSHDVQDFVGSKSRHLANRAKGIAHEAGEMMESGQERAQRGMPEGTAAA